MSRICESDETNDLSPKFNKIKFRELQRMESAQKYDGWQRFEDKKCYKP